MINAMKNFFTHLVEDLKERHQAGMKGWNENVAKPGDDMFFDDTDSGFRGHNDTGLYTNDSLSSGVPHPMNVCHPNYDYYWGNDN